MSTERLVGAGATGEEESQDRAIRPKRLSEYIGQPAVKAQLGLFIEAARARHEALDHVLVFGPLVMWMGVTREDMVKPEKKAEAEAVV
jgi:Holliday junction DNA helicase RuvB